MAATDEAIARLREMIATGAFAPGQRLPPEQELSELLGLSRGSMREAIKALQVLNILDVRRGDGTYVTSLEPELLRETISFVADIHNTLAVGELREVRRIVEASAITEAAHRASSADIERLKMALREACAPTTLDEARLTAGDYHRDLVDLAGNSYLSTIYAAVDGIASPSADNQSLGRCSINDPEHLAIIQAVASGDALLAEALVLAHAFKQEPQHTPSTVDVDAARRGNG